RGGGGGRGQACGGGRPAVGRERGGAVDERTGGVERPPVDPLERGLHERGDVGGGLRVDRRGRTRHPSGSFRRRVTRPNVLTSGSYPELRGTPSTTPLGFPSRWRPPSVARGSIPLAGEAVRELFGGGTHGF